MQSSMWYAWASAASAITVAVIGIVHCLPCKIKLTIGAYQDKAYHNRTILRPYAAT